MSDTADNGQLRRYSFVCLPYLNLGNISEIDLGFAKIWNFDLASTKYILDETLRLEVKKVLDNYQAYGRPIRAISLILVGANDFRELSAMEKDDVMSARMILAVSYLARHNTVTFNMNTGHQMVTSENFESVYFSVVPSEYVLYQEWREGTSPMTARQPASKV